MLFRVDDRKGLLPVLLKGLPFPPPDLSAALTTASQLNRVSLSTPDPVLEGEKCVTLTGSSVGDVIGPPDEIGDVDIGLEAFLLIGWLGSEEILGGGGGGIGPPLIAEGEMESLGAALAAVQATRGMSRLMGLMLALVSSDGGGGSDPNDNVNLSPPTETKVALDMSGTSFGGGESPVKFRLVLCNLSDDGGGIAAATAAALELAADISLFSSQVLALRMLFL